MKRAGTEVAIKVGMDQLKYAEHVLLGPVLTWSFVFCQRPRPTDEDYSQRGSPLLKKVQVSVWSDWFGVLQPDSCSEST